MTLGTIFTVVLILAAVGGALWGLFKTGIKVALFIVFAVALVVALLPYVPSALAAIFSSGWLIGFIVIVAIIWICQIIFG